MLGLQQRRRTRRRQHDAAQRAGFRDGTRRNAGVDCIRRRAHVRRPFERKDPVLGLQLQRPARRQHHHFDADQSADHRHEHRQRRNASRRRRHSIPAPSSVAARSAGATAIRDSSATACSPTATCRPHVSGWTSNVQALSGGYYYTCGVKSGAASCWGANRLWRARYRNGNVGTPTPRHRSGVPA